MIEAPPAPDEELRITALRDLHVLDTPHEERFDRITRLAQHLFEVPIAVISLIDVNRQWFKSCQGLDASETPRGVSFCAHAILSRDVFVIENALDDVRFADNPFVVGGPQIRFYAGAPLMMPDGHTVGTLCIISPVARKFDQRGRQLLAELADIIIAELDDVHTAARERDLRDFIESAGALIQGIDETGRVQMVNRAWSAALGYDGNEVLGKNFADFLDPTERERSQSAHAEAIATGAAVPLETVFVTKDGQRVQWSGTLNALRQHHGHALIRGVFQDVTAQRKLESLRSEVVHHVSHELKTPITSAVFALEMLSEMTDGWSEEQKQTLEVARESVQHASSMAADLMDVGRSESGKLKLEKKQGDLGAVLSLMHAAMTPLAQKAGLTLHTEEPQPAVTALFDPVRLKQILGNLIGNAIKFTPKGGCINVSTRPGPEGFIEVRVQDSGVGIAPKDLERIFDRLYQTSNKAMKGEVGLGLGLYICRELITAHRGGLGVESEAGKGTTFYFTLPLA